MYLDADDLRRCANCGAPTDGDVCDQFCADALTSAEEHRPSEHGVQMTLLKFGREPFYQRCLAEGEDACNQNDALSDNPYQDGTVAAVFWASGWKRGYEAQS
jgi:hypothetical protein